MALPCGVAYFTHFSVSALLIWPFGKLLYEAFVFGPGQKKIKRAKNKLTVQKKTGATFEAAGRAGSAKSRPESEIIVKNKQASGRPARLAGQDGQIPVPEFITN